MAYSTDNGRTFTNYAANPIIDLNRHGFRDPKVIWYAPTRNWIMVVSRADENFVMFYGSVDLKSWSQLSTFAHPVIRGVLECPQIVPIPLRDNIWEPDSPIREQMYLLAISVGGGASTVKYIAGRFNGTTFTPVSSFPAATGGAAKAMDFGMDSYATAFYYGVPETQNAISTSWAVNLQYATAVPTGSEGWKSAMSVPRSHFLVRGAADAYLLASLPVDLSSMRGTKPLSYVGGNAEVVVDYSGVSSGAIEYAIRISTPPGLGDISVVLEFYSSVSGEVVQVSIGVPAATSPTNRIGSFSMSRQGVAGWNHDALVKTFTIPNMGPFKESQAGGTTTETYEFVGIMDRTIMEVFLNGGIDAGTMIFFPTQKLDRMKLKVGGVASGALVSFEAWGLKSGWTSDDIELRMVSLQEE